MPRNQKEEFIFSMVIEIIMCIGMTVYNTVLVFTLYNSDHIQFTYQDFLAMMGEFLISLIIVFILGFFVTKVTPMLSALIWKRKTAVFKNVHHERAFIYTMIVMTVIVMCTIMSCLATVMYNSHVHENWSDFGSQFLRTWWHNACMAFPLQIIVCQPVARAVLKNYRAKANKII